MATDERKKYKAEWIRKRREDSAFKYEELERRRERDWRFTMWEKEHTQEEVFGMTMLYVEELLRPSFIFELRGKRTWERLCDE
jgi:hypothetical protein